MTDISWVLFRLVDQCQRSEWGFTAYRVAYGEGSDARWARFLTALDSGVRQEMDSSDCRSEADDPHHLLGNYDFPPAQQRDRLYSMFHLEARVDEAALAGASAEAVRARYQGQGGDEALPPRRVFLYVDDEVLDNIDTGGTTPDRPWVKVVEIPYEPERHQGNQRVPRYYFGVVKVALDSLMKLWDHLEMGGLDRCQPRGDIAKTNDVWGQLTGL